MISAQKNLPPSAFAETPQMRRRKKTKEKKAAGGFEPEISVLLS